MLNFTIWKLLPNLSNIPWTPLLIPPLSMVKIILVFSCFPCQTAGTARTGVISVVLYPCFLALQFNTLVWIGFLFFFFLLCLNQYSQKEKTKAGFPVGGKIQTLLQVLSLYGADSEFVFRISALIQNNSKRKAWIRLGFSQGTFAF